MRVRFLVPAFLLVTSFHSSSWGGNCLIQGGKNIGDCANVHVGPALPLNVTESGSFSGNYARVTLQSGVNASISGNTDDVIIRPGAALYLTGNSGSVRVEGMAELSGNSGWGYVSKGGMVIIRGVAHGVSGPGKVVKVPGSIIGGAYINDLPPPTFKASP